MSQLKLIAGVIMGLAVLAVVLVALHYRHLYHASQEDLAKLELQVKQQQERAATRLQDLTDLRDREQARVNQQAKEQEQKDEQAQAEIARLSNELRDRPVRVRVTRGACGGGAQGDAAAAADPGAGDDAAAYGVLPPENTRRLADAIAEVETLNAAYRSCRARLLGG
jgi:hypothetical protein